MKTQTYSLCEPNLLSFLNDEEKSRVCLNPVQTSYSLTNSTVCFQILLKCVQRIKLILTATNKLKREEKRAEKNLASRLRYRLTVVYPELITVYYY